MSAAEVVRLGDAEYSRPFPYEAGDVYPAGTLLVAVAYDDGDRFVTVAAPAVLAAWSRVP